MLDMQVFGSKHQVNKREIEPEADLAYVAYELSSKGKKTSLITKLPERWWFFYKKKRQTHSGKEHSSFFSKK